MGKAEGEKNEPHSTLCLLGNNTRKRKMAQPSRKKDNYVELVKLIRQISPVN